MALAQRMHASGESAATIAQTLRVSRVTVYRALADQNLKGDRRLGDEAYLTPLCWAGFANSGHFERGVEARRWRPN